MAPDGTLAGSSPQNNLCFWPCYGLSIVLMHLVHDDITIDTVRLSFWNWRVIFGASYHRPITLYVEGF